MTADLTGKEDYCNGRCNFQFEPTKTKVNGDESEVMEAILLCTACGYCSLPLNFVETETYHPTKDSLDKINAVQEPGT